MSISDRITSGMKFLLPSPMSIAILLTGFTIILALLFTSPKAEKILLLGAEDRVIAELYLLKPDFKAVKVDEKSDSLYLFLENGNDLVLKFKKSKEILFRQQILLESSEKLDKTVNIGKNRALRLLQSSGNEPYFIKILSYWEGGFFSFLTFAMQMMLILVLGHVLALTGPVSKLTGTIARNCTNTANSAFLISLMTMIVAFFNWGLGLIFGAVLARKVGEKLHLEGKAFNYPLIAAAGYSGMMVWHGGISGSSTLKIAEQNHEFVDKIGVIPVSDTIFSTMNITATFFLLAVVPLSLFFLGKKFSVKQNNIKTETIEIQNDKEIVRGMAKLDTSFLFTSIIGIVILFMGLYKAVLKPVYIDEKEFDWTFSFINPNYIIFILFGLAVLLQSNLKKFEKAVEEAIPGAAAIMIQFPFYAGIMGIMSQTGLVAFFAGIFENISTSYTFPLFTFISSGIVNFFVPSGGGQWLVQGPIVIEGANALGVSYEKSILALCYGDQLTNMLQPFWALPLLGITKLKAQEILPFSFFIFLMGFLIFSLILLIF